MTLCPVLLPDHEPLPFPCVFHVSACPHVRMSAPACASFAGLRPVCVRVLVRMCVCVRVFQESQWLDSVSLLIQDTLEGEMLMIDNLSGSVFHHYSSPPICRDCKGHLQEVPPPPNIITKGRGRFTKDTELQISSLSHCRCFRSYSLTYNCFRGLNNCVYSSFHPLCTDGVEICNVILYTEPGSGQQACRFACTLMDIHTLRASFIA